LYYYKRRYYSPTLGRFLQTDPTLKDEAFSLNLYRYVNNDPLNVTDPLGEEGIIQLSLPLFILALLALFAYLDFLKKLEKCNCHIPTIEEIFPPEVQPLPPGVLQMAKGGRQRNNSPKAGPPNSIRELPHGHTRVYGPDGQPVYDLNQPHTKAKNPTDRDFHIHEWDPSTGERGGSLPNSSPLPQPGQVSAD
jgi:uncharacterized protein RhaS with RHS repeats